MNGQEMTIMGNIFSLLQELGSLLKGDDASIEEPMVEEPMAEVTEVTDEVDEGMGLMDDELGEDEEMVAKGLETTPSDGMVANDDAEERVEEPLPEESADNVSEVAKSVLGLIQQMNGKKVAKSVKSKPNSTELILGEVAKVMKSLVDKQQEQGKAMVNLIDGLGIAKDIEQQYATGNKTVQKGLNNVTDVEKTLNFLAKSLEKKEVQKNDVLDNGNEVRKSMNSFIKQIQNANGKY